MGSGPSQPPNVPPSTATYTGPGVDPNMYNNLMWGGQGAGGGSPPFLTPGTDKPLPTMWDRLMNAVGQGNLPKMPGTTIGAPAGAGGMGPSAIPPPLPQGQMPPPRGMGAYFQALQQPPLTNAGNSAMMAQYMALQQLMRGG